MTLKKIVNRAWGLDVLDSIKLAKCMRCLFQVAISDSHDTATQLLAQIGDLAREASKVPPSCPLCPRLMRLLPQTNLGNRPNSPIPQKNLNGWRPVPSTTRSIFILVRMTRSAKTGLAKLSTSPITCLMEGLWRGYCRVSGLD